MDTLTQKLTVLIAVLELLVALLRLIGNGANLLI